MDINALLQQQMGGAGKKKTVSDTSETVVISPLALLKMLAHGKSGVPMEVMGLVLGRYVDQYTVHITDVFAMPQSGSGTSVEAVDEVYQAEMMDLLKRVGTTEPSVGWYHSHPGFGCWLSGTDQRTQASFEQLNDRAVAVVVDPVQSVRGNVVLEAFRLLGDGPAGMLAGDPDAKRKTTSNLGYLRQPPIQTIVHGLGQQYYCLETEIRPNEVEDAILHRVGGATLGAGVGVAEADTDASLDKAADLMSQFASRLKEQSSLDTEDKVPDTGRLDPKRHLSELAERLMESSVATSLTVLGNASAFSLPGSGEGMVLD
ncbi:hypothetical protein KIPB_000898 [Kipferlia bialata]|uniref:MPN domain-containing protein n=1 Tax=Kipferlia bialata TaxID=797122 RepID=A0A9K3CR93_9EUKA|nr:hypothetical protein KIPB_000898 [Kipferlia bialata]|eukprot:g898.t1